MSGVVKEVIRKDTVRNIGAFSCFKKNAKPSGFMVYASSTSSVDIVNGSYMDPNYINAKSLDVKSNLSRTMADMTTEHMVTENSGVLYGTNLYGVYELIKGLRRGLNVKAARKIIDSVYYMGAYDDAILLVKHTINKK